MTLFTLNAIAHRAQGCDPHRPETGRTRPSAQASRPDDLRADGAVGDPAFSISIKDSLDALGPEWPRMGDSRNARCHVFQTVEFLRVWQETYGRVTKARLCLVEARDAAGAPVMFVPLMIVRKAGARVLSFIDATAADYNAPIVFPQAWAWTETSAAKVWAAIKQALPPFDLVVLEKMPAAVGDVVNPLSLLQGVPNPESCHLTDLDKPWADVEKAFSGMRTLRKGMRALDRVAPMRMQVAETAAERAPILAKLLVQKQRRFAETHVPGFDRQPEKLAFFESATEAFAAAGTLHLAALNVGDEIVATTWGLLHGKSYYGLMIGSEADSWAKFSPGRVLCLLVAQWLQERGYVAMDVGYGDETWKATQCDVTVPLTCTTEVVGWRGQLLVRRDRTIVRLRGTRLWQRLRPYKWIVLRRLARSGKRA